jgi:hypothetical protein
MYFPRMTRRRRGEEPEPFNPEVAQQEEQYRVKVGIDRAITAFIRLCVCDQSMDRHPAF